VLLQRKKPFTKYHFDLGKVHNSFIHEIGRVLYLNEPERLLPAVAIAAADLALGVNFSSATFELILMNKSSIFYYPSRALQNKFVKRFKDVLIFESVNSIMNKIERMYSGIDDDYDVLTRVRQLRA